MIVNKQTKIYVGDSRIKKVNQGETKIYPLGQIFGVRRQISSSSPVWERLEDSVGLVANATHDGTAVRNDFDDLYPWSDIISYNYDIDNEQITAYYGDSNFKFDGTNGEVFTKIPEFWWRRYQEGDWEYIYISTTEQDDFTYSPEFSLARFLASGNTTKPRSIGDQQSTPIAYLGLDAARTAVRTWGKTNITLLDYHYFLIQLLYLVEYANYNSQMILGKGGSISNRCGDCNSLGMKSGSLSNNTNATYRGIEGVFGGPFQYMDGAIGGSNQRLRFTYDYTKYGTYSSYEYTTSFSIPGGFGKTMGYDPEHPLIMFQCASGGSSTTYICDGLYSSGVYNSGAPEVGGCALYGDNAGLWGGAIANSTSMGYSDSCFRFIKI